MSASLRRPHYPLVLTSSVDADIVCSRAKNHYDPEGGMDFEGSGAPLDQKQQSDALEAFKESFKPLNAKMRQFMYFS